MRNKRNNMKNTNPGFSKCQRVDIIINYQYKDNYYTNNGKIGYHWLSLSLVITFGMSQSCTPNFFYLGTEQYIMYFAEDAASRSFAKQARGWKRLRCSWRLRAWLMPSKCPPTPPTNHTWLSRRASTSYTGMPISRPSIIRSSTKRRDPSISRTMSLPSRIRYWT